jgi:hypothetical protein
MEPSPVQDNARLQDNPLPDRKDRGGGRAKASIGSHLSYFPDQRVPESEDAEERSNRHNGHANSMRFASLNDELAREKPRKDFRHHVYGFSPKPDREYLEIP